MAITKIRGNQVKPTKLLEFEEVSSTPPNPASGYRAIYATTANKLFTIGSDGLVRLLSTTEMVVPFGFSNGGSVLSTGLQYDAALYFPYQFLITQWTLGSTDSTSGSIQLDFWVDSYANFPPTVADSICASAKPNISSAIKGQSSTLTGWTTTVPAGSWLFINIDSVTSIKRISGAIQGFRI